MYTVYIFYTEKDQSRKEKYFREYKISKENCSTI